VVLCVEIRARPAPDSAWLAMLMRSIAAQTTEWRDTLLTGNVGAKPPNGGDTGQARLADLLARRG
jgi:hypothetical protein